MKRYHSRRLLGSIALLTASVLCYSIPARAQAGLIADINQVPILNSAGTFPNEFVNVGGTILFSTSEIGYGSRLWRSDGTTAGTVPVFGMPHNQFFSMQLTYAGTVGNVLYFPAQDLVHGRELWRTDGTTAGTYMIKDIVPGSGSSSPSNFAVLGTSVYFSAETPTHGIELWRTDGTASGTVMVADIRPGALSSRPFFLQRFGNKILFSGLAQLWITDGTAAGTVQLNPVITYPNQFTVLGNLVLFAASGPSGNELWRTDGTVAGTVLVADIRPGVDSSVPNGLVAANGRVFFSADDGARGVELWSSDGTAAGTQLVQDIVPGPGSSSPQAMQALGSGVVFAADRSAVSQPWFSDGTAAGTIQLSGARFEPHAFTVVPATPEFAVFRADGGGGRELWRTDGTPGGTYQVADINRGGHALGERRNFNFGVLGTTVLFAADDGVRGEEVWGSDGTSAGTRLVKDIQISVSHSRPRPLVEIDGRLLFGADDGKNGWGLWSSDGTAAGTKPFAPVTPLTTVPPVRIGPFVYFFAMDFFASLELWRTDGSQGGTGRVTVIGPWSLFVQPMVRVGDEIFFTRGNELWASDGTAAGTRRLFTFSITSPWGAGPQNLTAFQGKAWLTAEHNGVQSIWTSDGTTVGTKPFASVGRVQLEFTVAGGRMFFSNDEPANGGELWSTDGTLAGTGIVRDIVPGPSGSYPGQLTAVGGRVFFVPGFNRELWVSDGTTAGTYEVRNIHPSGTSKPLALTAFGNRLLFHAETPAAGREPWISDGTFAGTAMVGDLRPGAADSMSSGTSNPSDLFTVVGSGRIAMFSADDGVHGLEPWRTDGSSAGTYLAADIGDGPISSRPSVFARAGTAIVFAANDNVHGEELFGIELIDLKDSLAAPMGIGCAGTGGERPVLAPEGLPSIGNPNFALNVSNAAPNAPALLSVGLDIARFDFGPACYTLNATPLMYVGVATTAAGTARIPIPVPATVVRGSSTIWEVLVLDNRGTMLNIASLSNALLLMGGD